MVLTYSFYDSRDQMLINDTVQLEIDKPISNTYTKFPAIILIWGDYLDTNCFNILKPILLAHNFMVILINASFDYSMFFKLNDTLNYLLTRSDIDPSSINILGHSHGANYALLFGRMRSDIIHSVFCLDYGFSDQLMQDYFSYYHEIIDLNNYWTLTTFEKKFTLSLSNNSPANLFLLSDSNDQSFLNKISAINQTNTWWEDTQKNTIVSFSRG